MQLNPMPVLVLIRYLAGQHQHVTMHLFSSNLLIHPFHQTMLIVLHPTTPVAPNHHHHQHCTPSSPMQQHPEQQNPGQHQHRLQLSHMQCITHQARGHAQVLK
jgi:hypothetical protein